MLLINSGLFMERLSHLNFLRITVSLHCTIEKKKRYIMKEEQLLLTLSNLIIQLPILPTGSKKYTHGHIFLSMSIPAALGGVDWRRVWGVHFSNVYPDFINPNLPTDQYVLHVDIPNPQKV